MNRLARIGTHLIRTYFPELQQERFIFEIQKGKDWYLLYDPDVPRRIHHIKCEPAYVILPEAILTGGIAHELSHAVRDIPLLKRGTIMALGTKYNTNLKARVADERATDMLVITRGLGHALLASAEWQFETGGKKWKPDFGLHPTEIRAILAQQANGTLKTPSGRYR
ncbi:hypothetical protein EXS73_01920 [Candidatus Pacearchaeota archaeon]|nr:hypothetical protein [Candidatus Pacearchaeota archaeon]